MAIKTGTAKKIDEHGKYVDKYVAYTAGVAPASDPRFALVVVINDPQNGAYYGGAVSAPVFIDFFGRSGFYRHAIVTHRRFDPATAG
ncbi:penicillin-binding transpeptidase domain-containing protein [Enterobacter hormaechei]|uniref:penicillin-binding transpeptidase domain-containing protein n=1 Tax=Enterobacter hormaechei TaxID=158836 RepID=UPI003CC5B138